MKKWLALSFAVCLLVSLSGCARVPGLDWNEKEMVELHLYQGAVPADAHRKITTDRETIQQVARALFSLRVERDAVNEDVPCGGIGTYFVFFREDHSREAIHLGSNGDLLYTGEGFYKGISPGPGRPVELHRGGSGMGGREQAPGNRQLPSP